LSLGERISLVVLGATAAIYSTVQVVQLFRELFRRK
jgi:hypothetical protein